MTEPHSGLSIRIKSLTPGGLWMAVVALSAAVIAAMAAVAVLMLRSSDYWAGWRPVMLAVGVAWLIPVVGLLPLLRVERSKPIQVAQAAQLASAIRLGVAAVLSLLILLLLPGKPEKVAFGLWMMGLYVVGLALEMTLLAVWLKARPGVTRV